MSKFIEPKGINFSCAKEIDSYLLSKNLLLIIDFLRQLNPKAELRLFNDWWEHDGCHFPAGETDFDELLRTVTQNELKTDFFLSDFNEFIGIAPIETDWYLRFYLDEDADSGRFDITLPENLAELFETKVMDKITVVLVKQPSENFYDSIIC